MVQRRAARFTLGRYHYNIVEWLKSKYKTREEGERIRSKLEKFENNEKPTKYYFRQERKRGESKQINILVDGNNRTINTKTKL